MREQILAATLELLDETGDADAVSIRAVAERVGKTPPSIYLHFADKDELLHSVCELAFVELGRVSRQAQEGLDDPVDRICACARAYVQFAIDHPEQYRVLFMEPADMPPDQATLDALKEHVAFRSLHENVVDAFEQGRLVGPGPELTSLVMWSGVHGVASLLLAKPNFEWPPVEVFVDEVLRQHLEGLCPR